MVTSPRKLCKITSVDFDFFFFFFFFYVCQLFFIIKCVLYCRFNQFSTGVIFIEINIIKVFPYFKIHVSLWELQESWLIFGTGTGITRTGDSVRPIPLSDLSNAVPKTGWGGNTQLPAQRDIKLRTPFLISCPLSLPNVLDDSFFEVSVCPQCLWFYDSKYSRQQKVLSLLSMSVEIYFGYTYKNNNRPRTVPWGTPEKTGVQSDFSLFTPTCCCLKYRLVRHDLSIVAWAVKLHINKSWSI